jgi:hypothetical protein
MQVHSLLRNVLIRLYYYSVLLINLSNHTEDNLEDHH